MSNMVLEATPVADPLPYDYVQLRGQIHGLGGAWILLGLICLALAGYLFSLLGGPGHSTEIGANLIAAGSFGVCWMGLGIGAFLKKEWSIRGGLLAGYLAIAFGLVSFFAAAATPGSSGNVSLMPVFIQIVIIRQAHRVLRKNNDWTPPVLT